MPYTSHCLAWKKVGAAVESDRLFMGVAMHVEGGASFMQFNLIRGCLLIKASEGRRMA